MPYVGAIDQGTSSTRFMLFDHNGAPVASHSMEFPQIYPKAGENWVEHDPEEIYRTVLECMAVVMKKFKPEDVVAIGVTNQRETTVVWDAVTGKPLYNALVWLDTRTAPICEAMIAKYGSKDYFRKECGLPINPYFSAPKLKWLIDNSEEVQSAIKERRCKFGNIDSWLIYKLSGGKVHITDVTNASRTMLLDLKSRTWNKRVCDAFGIPMEILPTVRSSAERYTVIAEGVLAGTPITGCLGDQQAAMVGQLCFRKGSAKNTYGTGCFMLMNTEADVVESKHGLLTTVCYQLGPDAPVHYALEGSVAVAGVCIKWLRDRLGLIGSAAETEDLARSVSSNGGVYFVPAFSGLFAPYWRSDARGTICGLTLETTRAHLVRAALEAVCFRTREVVAAMQQESNATLSELRVDGGMTANQFVLQFQADITGARVAKPPMLETTALGAAIAAGLAVGYWKSVDEVSATIGPQAKLYHPQMDELSRAQLLRQWDKAIQRSLNWTTDDGTQPTTISKAHGDNNVATGFTAFLAGLAAGIGLALGASFIRKNS